MRITIDLGPTDDPTHGAQQLAFFNRFYDTSCYLPLAGFLTFDDEVEQYLFCYVLRTGNVAAKHGAISVLKRLLRRLRRAFPRARLRIRLDAGFSGPELYAFFEAQKLEYVVAMAKTPGSRPWPSPWWLRCGPTSSRATRRVAGTASAPTRPGVGHTNAG